MNNGEPKWTLVQLRRHNNNVGRATPALITIVRTSNEDNEVGGEKKRLEKIQQENLRKLCAQFVRLEIAWYNIKHGHRLTWFVRLLEASVKSAPGHRPWQALTIPAGPPAITNLYYSI